jgi:topB: DNA topoisomerase III
MPGRRRLADRDQCHPAFFCPVWCHTKCRPCYVTDAGTFGTAWVGYWILHQQAFLCAGNHLRRFYCFRRKNDGTIRGWKNPYGLWPQLRFCAFCGKAGKNYTASPPLWPYNSAKGM